MNPTVRLPLSGLLRLRYCTGLGALLAGLSLQMAATVQAADGIEAAVPASAFTLTIRGEGHATPRSLDVQTLRALGATQLVTAVPWDTTVRTWEGISIKRLFAASPQRMAGHTLRFKALNDYSATIPWSDIETFDPILAWQRDGQAIPVRAKGPLLVIFPFNERSELRNKAEYIDRSVWHVSEIIVE